MLKQIKYALVVIISITTITFISCSKDDDTDNTKPVEQNNPLIGKKWLLYSENGIETPKCHNQSSLVFTAKEVTRTRVYNDGTGVCKTINPETIPYTTDGKEINLTSEGVKIPFTISGNTMNGNVDGTPTVYKAE